MSEQLHPVLDSRFLVHAAQQGGIELDELKPNKDSVLRGFTVVTGRTVIIALRKELGATTRAFTLAHELGHVALKGHLLPGRSGEGKWPFYEREYQADLWAARTLLGPSHATAVEDIIRFTLQQYSGPKAYNAEHLREFAQASAFLAAIAPEVWLADPHHVCDRDLQGLAPPAPNA